jgi:hypothetical protein
MPQPGWPQAVSNNKGRMAACAAAVQEVTPHLQKTRRRPCVRWCAGNVRLSFHAPEMHRFPHVRCLLRRTRR